MYANYKDRGIDLFRKLEWIPFYDEAEIMKCSIIYNREYTFSDMFPRNTDIQE
jgi:hypothetical protein